MTQGENVNPYPRKQKRIEGKFPIKEKRRKISSEREKRKERKFPIKEWEKEKRKERKFPTKEWEKVKKTEAPGQRNQKKCRERSLDETISEPYRITDQYTKSKIGNHGLE